MGLFSFLKNAGSKIFGKAEPTVSAEELHAQKLESLNSVVSDLELPVEHLTIELFEDQVTVYGETESQDIKEKVVLALGNVDGIASVDDRISVVNPAPEAVFYEVKSGDSLSKIAKAHYGNPMKYMAIFEANQPLLKDPNLIYPGQVLRIPPLEA
jgi:nucleoid-associated protein YgaU